jgi:hypothetical protein
MAAIALLVFVSSSLIGQTIGVTAVLNTFSPDGRLSPGCAGGNDGQRRAR